MAANITATGFDVALERSESLAGEVNNPEVIAYLAIPDGALSAFYADTDADGMPDDQVLYEAQQQGGIAGWSNGGGTVNFLRTYAAPPLAVASKDSRDGSDGGWLRRRRGTPTTDRLVLYVDEDRDRDSERGHVVETVGVAVFSHAFHANFQVVQGHVYEDPAGDANTTAFVPRANVPVTVYLDDGDGVPNAGDLLIASTTTDANGAYAFLVTSGGTYWVAVDSKGVTPAAGYNASFDQNDVWAEQTYGPAGAWCANPDGLLGGGDPYERTSSGVCYGGKDSAASDDASALATAEHIARIAVNNADVNAVDFAFSFNVVTNANDQDDDASANRTAQGTLRQFIQNANAVAGANAMRFVPAVSTNANNGSNAWWRVYVQNLDSAVDDELTITDPQTTVDGTAYSYADGTSVRDTNTAAVTAPETAGVSQNPLSAFPGPELEMANANVNSSGFTVDADDVVIRRMAIYHMHNDAAVFVEQNRQNVLIEENFLSARADGSDPGWLDSSLYGINTDANGGMDVDARHNYVAYSSNSGLNYFGTGDVTQNLIEQVGSNEPCADGITIHNDAMPHIQQNVIQDVAAYAIDGVDAWGNYTIEENTMTLTGQGDRTGAFCQNNGNLNEDELGGIRVGGSDVTVVRNVIHDTPGHGAVVFGERVTLTQNAFYNNAGISIDLFQQTLGHSYGDGLTPNDGATDAAWGNEKQDYPIFSGAILDGNQLTVEGYIGTPSSTTYDGQQMTIEIYKADDDGNNNGEVISGDGKDEPHGEGHWYLDVCIITLGANGAFTCTVTVPGTVSLASGDYITAIATEANGNTSEFSNNFKIAEADLSLDKRVTPSEAHTGDTVAFTITVSNGGPDEATNVAVTDQLPSGYTLQSSSASQGAYSSNTGIWSVGSLASGTNATLVFTAIVNSSGNYTNTAEITASDQIDPDSTPGNSDDTEDDYATAAVNPLPKAADDTASTGEDTPVTVSVLMNDDFGGDGPGSGAISVATQPLHGTVTVNDGGTPNDPTDDTITYAPDTNYNGIDTFEYQICDASGDCDIATVTVTVTPTYATDLSIAKDDGIVLVASGGTVTYTIVVTNNGPDDVNGARVEDAKPAVVTTWTWACSGATGGASGCDGVTDSTADFSDAVNLPANSSITYTVTAHISAQASGTLENTVTAALPNGFTELTPDDNTATDSDALAVTGKRLDDTNQTFTSGSDVAIGEIVTYEAVLDIPAGQVQNLTLTDIMAQGLAFVACESITGNGLTSTAGTLDSICSNPVVSAEPAGSTAAEDQGRKVVWNFGDVTNATGSEVTLTVRYQAVVLDSVANQSGISLDNQAEWAWTGGSQSASAPPVTVVEPDLAITKTASPVAALDGEVVTFTLTIQHTAASETPAHDVEISDVLPAALTYVNGSLAVVSGPTPTSMGYNAATRTITVVWDTFAQGNVANVQFQARLAVSSPQEITNVAAVAWSSLPGDVSQPQSQHNTLSHERAYDPNSPADVYRVEDEVAIQVRLPDTGFAPERITAIPVQTTDYSATAMRLVIPRLDVDVPIVGVPRKEDGWDLTWLWNQAGWLEGTAFPTWAGNTAITAHVYLPDGEPGPFVNLRQLMWGDRIEIRTLGERYVYAVRSVKLVRPEDADVLTHRERDWLTLITCQGYDEAQDTYRWRLVVQAVLIDIVPAH